MAFLGSTFAFNSGERGIFSGILAWIDQAWEVARWLPFPPNTSAIEGRPSIDAHANRLYLVGGHSRNILIDEDLRVLAQGILPPAAAPSVSAGAGTVDQIAYLRYYDEITGERSSLSDGKVFTGNTSRAWTSLPTEVQGEITSVEGTYDILLGAVTGQGDGCNLGDLRPGDRIAKSTDLTRWAQLRTITTQNNAVIDDIAITGTGVALVAKLVSRVSHVEGWLRVQGALPRFVWRARIGTSSISESVATLALGEALVDTYEPMPRGTINVVYNQRQVVAGVPGSLDTIYLSEIDHPENHAGLRFRTKYGEPVVGMLKYRTYVIVLAVRDTGPCSYRLQGYVEDDYSLDELDPDHGGIGHHGNVVVGGRAIIPSRDQPYIFDSAFRPAMPTRSTEWARNYRNNPDAWEAGLGVNDPNSKTYRFMPQALRLGGVSDPLIASAPASTIDLPDATIFFLGTRGGTSGMFGLNTVDGVVTMYAVGRLFGDDFNTTKLPIMVEGVNGKFFVTGRRSAGGGARIPGLLSFDPAALGAPWTSLFEIAAGASATRHMMGVLEDPASPDDVFTIYGPEFSGGGETSRTYLWDGAAANVDDDQADWASGGNSAVTAQLVEFNGSVLQMWTHGDPTDAIFVKPSTRIRRRTGVATWANLVLPAEPAGVLAATRNWDCYLTVKPTEFGGNLFVAVSAGETVVGGRSYFFKIDGAFTVTLEDVIPPGESVVALLNSGDGTRMYAVMQHPSGRHVLGYYDGAWHMDAALMTGIPDVVSIVAGPKWVAEMNLYLLVATENAVGAAPVLYASRDLVDWVAVHFFNAGDGLKADDFFVAMV